MNGRTEQTVSRTDVEIPAGDVTLSGILAVPEQADALVVFAHGAGSSRFSPRNQRVAEVLQETSLATLLMDLLTEEEEQANIVTQKKLSFDIEFLAARVEAATHWVLSNDTTREMRIGYFGASTGAAAALTAAAREPDVVGAIVSRGGRPDLARDVLSEVKAPTLLIVGGQDITVLEMNREAAGLLNVKHEVVVVPGATHLFEEPGKLDEVAEHAAAWFGQYLKYPTDEPGGG